MPPRLPPRRLDRRQILSGAGAALATLMLTGCDRWSSSPSVRHVLSTAEQVNLWLQRRLIGNSLAREYDEADLSPQFKANGSTAPDDPTYRQLAAKNFADWRLEVGGLVERPVRLSLAELRSMPARSQITRHDCVEGWSCIGKWTGVPLGDVLNKAGLRPQARYVVFYCIDSPEDDPDLYYESIDMVDAFHPQTILAYAMNDKPLTIPHGAPLRLRVERQLGYKMAKYVMQIDVVDDLTGIGHGRGGYWEDRGYEWYAGI